MTGFTSLVLTQMLMQVVTWFFGFFSALFVARFILQWVRAPFRNPIGQFIVTLTNWAVLPARRVVPGLFGNDLASLVVAWLTETIAIVIVTQLGNAPVVLGDAFVPLAFAAGAIETVRTVGYVILGATIGVVVLSWINPHAPMAPLLNAVAQPFLRPFQRRIPSIAGLDLSPLLLLLLLQMGLGLLAYFKYMLLGVTI